MRDFLCILLIWTWITIGLGAANVEMESGGDANAQTWAFFYWPAEVARQYLDD